MVHTVFRKWRSWLTTIIRLSHSRLKSSSHSTAWMSRWLVGSSSRMMSGLPKRAWASSTFTFSLAVSVLISLYRMSSDNPRPWIRRLTSLSASQPSMSANSASSSLAFTPSASVKSSLA